MRIKFLLILVLFLLILFSNTYFVFGLSPSFVRQEVIDSSSDGWDHLTQKFITTGNFLDLKSITFYSNGNILNSTFFLNPLNSLFTSIPKVNYTAHGMLIDIDNDIKSGWEGFDYVLTINWKNDQKIWTYELEELSSMGSSRTLVNKSNFTDFFDIGKNNYVYLSLDLAKINYPDKFLVVFFTDYDFLDKNTNKNYEITDFSDLVLIPPPKFEISTYPSSIMLRPGEEQIVQIHLNSSNNIVKPTISFYTKNNVTGLSTYIIPAKMEIPSAGFVTTDLHIQALKNSDVKTYTLPLYANIEFPIQKQSISTNEEDIRERIKLNHNIIVNVLKPFTFEEKFGEFWNTYGGAVSLIGGGFIAGISGILIEKLRKSRA